MEIQQLQFSKDAFNFHWDPDELRLAIKTGNMPTIEWR